MCILTVNNKQRTVVSFTPRPFTVEKIVPSTAGNVAERWRGWWQRLFEHFREENKLSLLNYLEL
jgi:hypothetical protein